MRIEKPWGHEIHFAVTEKYIGKILFVKKGHRLSLQYHKQKDETLYCLEGRANLIVENGNFSFMPGHSYRVKPMTVHRVKAMEDTTLIEVSTPEINDVVRVEDDYGRVKDVAVSGGFDPVHIGHIRLFREASKLGSLTVILNTDDFLMKKKGFVFMPLEERREIIQSIRYVDKVVISTDKDMTVCDTLTWLKPDIFANGGDRVEGNTPEYEVCKRLGIEMVFGVGGDKVQSSSQLTGKLRVVG